MSAEGRAPAPPRPRSVRPHTPSLFRGRELWDRQAAGGERLRSWTYASTGPLRLENAARAGQIGRQRRWTPLTLTADMEDANAAAATPMAMAHGGCGRETMQRATVALETRRRGVGDLCRPAGPSARCDGARWAPSSRCGAPLTGRRLGAEVNGRRLQNPSQWRVLGLGGSRPRDPSDIGSRP